MNNSVTCSSEKITKQNLLQLAENYGDSFYLLDSVQFLKNYSELKSAFQVIYPHFNIAYSYKTNYVPKLCKMVNKMGGYAEVVSEMEMEIALKCGVEPTRIIWNGPVKDMDHVEDLLIAGGCVNIDNLTEAERIQRIAYRHRDKVIQVGIRCNFDVGDGTLSRFGLDVDGEEFDVSKRTTAATKLNQGEKLLTVQMLSDAKEESIVLQTEKGMFLRFLAVDVPKKKKGAVGVRGMKIAPLDRLKAVFLLGQEEKTIVEKDKQIMLHRLRIASRDQKGVKK